MNFSVSVVLPASGSGERVGSSTPKQFLNLLNRPLLSYTIEAFERVEWIQNIVVVLSAERMEYARQLVKSNGFRRVILTEGASTRHRSIYRGLHILSRGSLRPDVAIIHDAVRPFVTEDTLKKVALAAHENGAAGVTRPLVSTVVKSNLEGVLEESLDRSKYHASEMPQAFKYSLIKSAYEQCTDYDLDYGTECLHLALKYLGIKASLLDGTPDLWKVTHKKDVYAAEGMLREHLNHTALKNIPVALESNIKESILEKGMKVVSENGETANNFVFFHDSFKSEYMELITLEKFSNQEMLHGGTTVHIMNSATDCFGQLQALIHRLSAESTQFSSCVNAVFISESSDLERISAIVTDLIFNRNINFSGQVFMC